MTKEWLTVLVATLFMLFAIGATAWWASAPTLHFVNEAHGEEATVCDYPESLITTALVGQEDRLVAKLEGKALASFLSKMEAKGYMSGSLPNVSTLYIIKGKMLPGHEQEPIDILFFVNTDGCIVGKVYGSASVVEEML